MKVGQRIVEVVFKGVDQTSGAMSSMQQKLGQMGKDVPALGAAFDLLKNPITLITSAVVGLASAIKKAGDNSIRLGASFQDMANRTDMSVESLARWKFIAEQNGSSIDEFEQAFRKLRNTMADAATGNQQAIDVFNRLGISATDANGNMRDLETVLLEIGQAVREHGAASIEGAAAQDALGRSSAGVVAIIKQQSDALRAQISEASAYSSNMTSAWAAAADAADDAMAKFRAARENANAGSTKWWATFRKDWAEGWADFILYNTNNAGWEQLRKSEEDAAKAASRAVAVAYTGGLISGLEQGESSSAIAQYQAGRLNELAAQFKVATTEKKWSAESGAFIDVQRTADAISADILKAQDDGIKKARENGEARQKAYADLFSEMDAKRAMAVYKMAPVTIESPIKFKAVADPLALAASIDLSALNDAFEMPALKGYQQEMIDAGKATMYMAAHLRDMTVEGDQSEAQMSALADAMRAFAETDGMDPEVLAAVLAYYKQLNVELGKRKEATDEAADAEEELKDIGRELKDNLQEIGVTAVDAFLNGEAGAIKFGDMIRRTITRAIAEAIVKLIIMKAIAAMTNNIIGAKDGGRPVPARAFGGRIPGYAAGGYAVPDGPRGMDSRMIMAMPGEEVINRQLSMRMDRMVTAFEQGAAVSPFALSGAGGGRSTVINFNVARPVNVLDALSLGRDAVTASRKYSEAVL